VPSHVGISGLRPGRTASRWSYTVTYPNRDAIDYAVSDSQRYSNTVCHAYTFAATFTKSVCQSDAHAYANPHAFAFAKSHSHSYSYSYTHSNSHSRRALCNADLECEHFVRTARLHCVPLYRDRRTLQQAVDGWVGSSQLQRHDGRGRTQILLRSDGSGHQWIGE
jgi:hypothetical protein